jgi:hypothetical protein
MKRTVFMVVLMAVAAGGIFAQEGESARHWISGGYNTGTIITGGAQANYEFLLPMAKEKFSVTVQAGTRFLVFPQFLVGGRFYPWGGGAGNPGTKFHADIEVGYNILSDAGFALEAGLGWKFDVGEPNGFFVDLELVAGIPVVAGAEIALGWAF